MGQYKADLRIDKYNIDNEILQQAQLSYEWAYRAGVAENEKDEAKDKYDLLLVEIEEAVRANPEKFIDSERSITEGAIKNAVNSHPKVKRALKEFQKRRKIFKLLSKAEKKFEERKKMIEAYLYHTHRMMDGDPKVPRKYERDFSNNVKKEINGDLKNSWDHSKLKRRRGR